MNPLKSLVPLAKWLLRFSAIAIIYTINYLELALSFSFNSPKYLMALAYSIITILLVVGGFQKTAKLTVISGFLLVLISIIDLFAIEAFSVPNLIASIPLTSIGFYFMARGNEG
jgi:hypothetical protein